MNQYEDLSKTVEDQEEKMGFAKQKNLELEAEITKIENENQDQANRHIQMEDLKRQAI